MEVIQREVSFDNFYFGQYFLCPAIFSAILNANADIVSEGFTPNGVGIIEPSITYNPS